MSRRVHIHMCMKARGIRSPGLRLYSYESSMRMLGTEPLEEQYSCLTTGLSLNPKFVTFQECLVLAKNDLIKYNNQKNWLDKFVMIHLSTSIFAVDIRCKVAGFSSVELV